MSCERTKTTKETKQPLYQLVPKTKSNIDFINKLTETDSLNYFNYGYIYMGGGISVGDVDNDGLDDVFFTGNMVKNRLYLNKGNLEFEDITETSNISGTRPWNTGSTMVDINNDGLLDIYVCASGKSNYNKKNELYINNGDLTFTEKAEIYGIADIGNSVQASFFDFDKDGDLDLYVANYPITSFKSPNIHYKAHLDNLDPKLSDNLYENVDGKFQNITKKAGVLNYGLTLSVAVGDMNNDGWPDLYVSNDFASPDYLYLNNQDGTFENVIAEATNHTAMYGMGTDIADFNNDGRLDILQLDMTPEDNHRSKANMASMNISKFDEMIHYGLHYQYMQNALQLNLGNNENGIPIFGDVSRMNGLATTDWSWGALFLDFNNDGYKDVFITNGTRRDINNKDFFNNLSNKIQMASNEKAKEYQDFSTIPSKRIPNYAYLNTKEYTFSEATKDLGLYFEGFSNGVAYADLDNDGDLELIVNNLDDTSQIYENTGNISNNYIKFSFKGSNLNPFGIGIRIEIEGDDFYQTQEHYLTRGFQSSVAPGLHFGLGKATTIKKATIFWTDGNIETINNVKANQELVIDYKNSHSNQNTKEYIKKKLFKDITKASKLTFTHTENYFDDYAHEILLPHRMSRFGPGLTVADVNGDQLEDFFIGNATKAKGVLYIQQINGTFLEKEGPWDNDIANEDLDALFFDADNDGDHDLYVVSGGSEWKKDHSNYQDRLYLNNGQGDFTKSVHSLPSFYTSGSRVKAYDYDNDGDLDLFVGGRLVPQQYPLPANSHILRNEGIQNGIPKFEDVTKKIAPILNEIGMVTDAIWTDFNNDNNIDLIVTGEWMSLTFLENTGTYFENKTEVYGMKKQRGWWFSIEQGDFDNDGDMDYVAGNLGLNYKYQTSLEAPFSVYANDFDANGKLDIVLGYHQDGKQYPVRGRQCSSQQIPAVKSKFKNYESFSTATLVDIYSKNMLEHSVKYDANTFASSYIENNNGRFSMCKLPILSQISSINKILVEDFDNDGNLDLVTAGNLYASEIETPRNDAGIGVYMKGDGKGNFSPLPANESGLMLRGDVKDLSVIQIGKSKKAILAGLNNDVVKIIEIEN